MSLRQSPSNLNELATLIEQAIREQNQVGRTHEAAIRRVAVAVARHGSRYAHHTQLTSSTSRLDKHQARRVHGVILHRATAEFSELGILLAPLVNALMAFAVRWFLDWMLKRLENRDAVAAIAAGQAAWVSTEAPEETEE